MKVGLQIGAATLVLILAILGGGSAQRALAISAIALPPVFASFWWFNRRAGVPVIAMFGIISVLYYAVPIIINANFLSRYTDDEVLGAGITVCLFLLSAITTSEIVARRFACARAHASRQLFTNNSITQISPIPAIVGLAMGCLYQIAAITGWIAYFGSLATTIRAICAASAVLGAFLLGSSGSNKVQPISQWVAGVLLLVAFVAMNLVALLLIYATLAVAAAIAGYVLSTRKIPIVLIAIVITFLTIFNAGKSDIRERYWDYGASWNTRTTLLEVPSLIGEWLTLGLDKVASGTNEASLAERTTLLDIVLLVRHYTPDTAPYLNGITYTLAPANIVPRIFDEKKGSFHDGTVLLGVYYGLQTSEGSTTASIAIGLIAEAWANFGYLGLVIVGASIGLLAGIFEGLSIGRDSVSLETFLAFSVALNLFNLENDAGTLAAILPQAIIASVVFYLIIKWTLTFGRKRSTSLKRTYLKARST